MNFSLPDNQEKYFDSVIFVELERGEAERVVREYAEEARKRKR